MINFFKKHRIISDIVFMLGLFVFTVLSYLIFKPLYFKSEARNPINDGVPARIFIYILIILTVGVGIYWFFKKKLSFKRVVFLLFIISYLIKLNYLLITPYNYRQHDTIDTWNHAGHEDYAWIIYSTGKLPTTNSYQFYHPCLNAAIQAGFMHVMSPFLQISNFLYGEQVFDVSSMHVMFETTEILSLMYMTVCTYFSMKLALQLKVNKIAKYFGLIFLMFFPRLICMAAQENNDPLVIMFSFIAIYYTFRWWQTKSWASAITIGASVGLAMMTKFSGAIIAVVPFVAFVIEFINSVRKNEHKVGRYLSQAGVVIGVAAVLGLWFQVYAYVRFNQPFGYVFDGVTSAQLKTNYNVFQRFINIFDFYDLFQCIYGNTFVNYNLFDFTLRSAMCGEFSFLNGDAIRIITEGLSYIFVILSLVIMIIYFVVSKKDDFKEKILASTLFVSQIVAQIYFNVRMPYGCTMDFRYIVPIIIGFGVLDMLAINKLIYKKGFVGLLTKITTGAGLLLISLTSLFYLIVI